MAWSRCSAGNPTGPGTMRGSGPGAGMGRSRGHRRLPLGDVNGLGVRDPRISRNPDLEHAVFHPCFESFGMRAERQGQGAPELSKRVFEILDLESIVFVLLGGPDLARSRDLEKP